MEKKKSCRLDRKANSKSLKQMVVSLDDATAKTAVKLGGGDLSLGIRRAVALTSLRQGTADVSVENLERRT